ncbi:MAG TPA: hypothetical protein VMZ90_08955 [Vicinamibacterales bacterium]|nr:hypothetical protein [Vicinamibacterales bacterium]
MALSRHSTLREVVQAVSASLRRHRIEAILTGGACASLHSNGDYLSQDLDYIIRNLVTRTQLDDAMTAVGFARTGAEYQHPDVPFFVEFPKGPLAIGDDDLVEPIEIRVGSVKVLTLSATDSCRDRLAAFYHWNDLQSLRVAAAIARRRTVNLNAIRAWSVREGRASEFRQFEREITAAHSAREVTAATRPSRAR